MCRAHFGHGHRDAFLFTVAIGLSTLTAYIALLGWDQSKDLQPDGTLTGPYERWQVLGLILAMSLIGALAGWRQRPWIGVAATTVMLTTCWVVDAVTDPASEQDGLWPIGAAMVALGTFAGIAAVSFTAQAVAQASSADKLRPRHSRVR